MILRDEDAREKWCPFARSYDNEETAKDTRPVTINRARGGAADIDCFCIGSDCMAWQWAGKLGDAVGYCGLAGKPKGE